MQNTTSVQARSLLDDCGQLIHLARIVARSALDDPACTGEAELALEQVTRALGSLRDLCGGRASPRRVQNGVVAIAHHMLDEPRPAPPAAPADAGQHLLSGHSRTIPIPDLLGLLQVQRKTGELLLELATERISIYFERGELVAALSSNSPPDCLLGQLLVTQGALRRGELEEFLERHSSMVERLGGALEVRSLVTEEQLVAALTTQIERLFQRLLAAEEVGFEFREGVRTTPTPELQIDVSRLLLEAVAVPVARAPWRAGADLEVRDEHSLAWLAERLLELDSGEGPDEPG